MLSLVLTLSETMCVTGDLATRLGGGWLPGEQGLWRRNLALCCLRLRAGARSHGIQTAWLWGMAGLRAQVRGRGWDALLSF